MLELPFFVRDRLRLPCVEEYQDSKLTNMRTCPEEKHEEFKIDSVRKVCDGILSPKDLEQKLKGLSEYFYRDR
jgi:hypothetical protein